MSYKVNTWHEHPKLGKVKIIGVISKGVVTVHQVYKNGVSMLFFERNDRNAPCGFSREEVRLFETLLSNAFDKKNPGHPDSVGQSVTEVPTNQNSNHSGLRALLGLNKA